ncbi:ATP-binding protein [Corynebacterium kozikiae]|uniref:ATP-binding protein n=1 Tax=Corynebacterium kozikiae TaxID=2968469 RepID=UPI00211CE003|nr:DUF4143 domain-containing protein [Corynebacterium sp. 76QC2CO]
MSGIYVRRVIDDLLDNYMEHLPAIAIEGPKGVGKTATALQRAAADFRLDNPGVKELLEARPELISESEGTLLLDEWQRYTPSWDLVRRAVDDGAKPGSYLLTGSAFPPVGSQIHSGAARIDTIRMRPFAVQERSIAQRLVGLIDFFSGNTDSVQAQEIDASIEDYATEVCRSGLPGIMDLPEMLRTRRLDSYIQLLATHEFPQLGLNVRNPGALTRWLRAYAMATSQTTSYTEILDSATPGESEKPSRGAAEAYRNLLEQLMILEPLPAWSPVQAKFPRTIKSPKHHLCDPALAARLLGENPRSLLSGDPKQAQLFAQLFESLVVLSVRVAAEALNAKCWHLRTQKGDREIDVVVEDENQRIVGIEVKVSPVVKDDDVKHLLWLKETIGPKFAAGVVVHAGKQLYRRADGIWVVPLAALY